MRQVLAITRKELEGYFGSPLALIFLGSFLAVELLVFFNVETFFARNIADIRPLFTWMPILLILLLAALTMRQWSEEQRSGTLEVLLTLPVNLIQLVVGKFLAVMGMIFIALALTLPLPITVSLLGNLDWGPVLGGYLAAFLMAAAYAAIGLFVSSRTDNQIVALISTVLIGGIFYFIGTRTVTDFFGSPVSDVLWALGTGSRFESIERGVIDLRDLIFYLSVAGFFLLCNVISLDSIRWSRKPEGPSKTYQTRFWITSTLIGLNLIFVNVWLFPLQGLRLDLTSQREYSLSPTTHDLISNLSEPLLIRAYISSKTHPLLAPLVPRVRDMLREYEIASGGLVKAEVIDPLNNPEAEAEANQTYGIKPTPFRVTGRHEASVINSYFDILVRYGDQSVVLNFGDLVEIEQMPDRIDVRLRNLEYDLTRAIKKVVYGFQSVDAVLAAMDNPVKLTLFETPNTVPKQLSGTEAAIKKVAGEIQEQSKGKFVFEIIDPTAANSPITPQALAETYGIEAVPVALFSSDTFFFHLLFQNGDNSQLLYPSSDMSEGEVRTAIESALKRTASGFLKTVGLAVPSEQPTQNMFGQQQPSVATFRLVRQQLGREYTVRDIDLTGGVIPNDVDVLFVISPQGYTDKEKFAIDQYLMRGGSVVIVTNPFKLDLDLQSQPILARVKGGIQDLLGTYGIKISDSLVMDAQSDVFPATVTRKVGEIDVQEIQPIIYPYFIDIRPNGMDTKNPITSNLTAVTLNWAAPMEIDQTKTAGRETSVLLRSSAQSWLNTPASESAGVDFQPNYTLYPQTGFPQPAQGEKLQSYPLGISMRGEFESAYKGKPSPMQESPVNNPQGPASPGQKEPEQAKVVAPLERSPNGTRLVVLSSSDFLNDTVLDLSARLTQERFQNNLHLIQNAIDWSAEDLDLLSIRARGTYTRVLLPVGDRVQNIVEFANYAIALIILIGLYIFWQMRKRSEKPMALLPKKEANKI
jgi:ABC-2 type transport system permease protein